MRPPRLRCTLFPLIYPPHLLVLLATFGLHLLLQTYPYFRALYVISVRRTKSLPTASFRFHLTMDTLVVQLYTSSLPRRVRDFHPLERAHGAQTKGSHANACPHIKSAQSALISLQPLDYSESVLEWRSQGCQRHLKGYDLDSVTQTDKKQTSGVRIIKISASAEISFLKMKSHSPYWTVTLSTLWSLP